MSVQFVGIHDHTLDAKGRLILPAKFRDAFATGLYLAPGKHGALTVFTVAAYEQRIAEVQSRPEEDDESMDLLRILTNSAHADVPDAQGRITIPLRQREYAGLEREVIVAGTGARVEIWNPTRYDEYRSRIDQQYAARQ